jgi:hypothetical protein
MRHQSLYALLWAACAHAATPSFVGAKVCGGCHPAQSKTQSASAHASALYRPAAHPLAASFGGQKLVRAARYRFDFVRSEQGFDVKIDDGANLMTLPVDWAFGAGQQAVTFVSRVDRQLYIEHYGSYYSKTGSFGATPGQDAVHPASISEAAGVLYKIRDPQTGISGCFECHSTGPVSFDDSGAVHLTEAGVRCESCHGPGSAHAADPTLHKLRNPAMLSASDLNQFCGRCHRPPASAGVTIDWNYAWNVRHQPVYLSHSRCFLKSGNGLSCLTCHDPHEPARTAPAAFYNQKCEGCHSTSSHPPGAVCLEEKPANCINCHMPLVSPQPPLRFTNHWIGIYRNAAMLKPVR